MNSALEELAARVSPAVVQIQTSGYGPLSEGDGDRGRTALIVRQRAVGSGVIVDANGYIMTNAHVVERAQRIRVALPMSSTGSPTNIPAGRRQLFDAKVLGIHKESDLALLKIEQTDLPTLSLEQPQNIRVGQMVLAVGSPEGLQSSVTMGVISAVARQADPTKSLNYVQTDAPINPGNSGGPLVNVDGELVGLNTLILTESGGSQGMSFAIPSAIVASAYPQLRKYGHLHRGLIGFSMQAITPALAVALGLSRTSGVVVSDVMPDSAAEAAGLGVKDVVATVNGRPMESVPMLALELSRYAAGDAVTLGLLRGKETVSVTVTVRERPHPIDDLAGLADPERSSIPKLGIIGIDVGDATAARLPGLRISSGVFVAARTVMSSGNEVPLIAGDVIHAVNSFAVRSVDGLSVLVDDAKANSELVLQIERNGQLLFVTCQIY
jgi:serine protease Do